MRDNSQLQINNQNHLIEDNCSEPRQHHTQ
ncbi:hypothetical protein TNCT_128471, partial [Trichonephila clavata]